MGTNPDSAGPEQRALVENPIIISSLLTRDIQEHLITEIEEKVLAALLTPTPEKGGKLRKLFPKKPEPPMLYFVRSATSYEGSVNYPFYIVRSNTVKADLPGVEGPFNPQLTCSMAYLFTEGLILGNHSTLNDRFKQSLGLSKNTQTFGAGITALAEHISSSAKSGRTVEDGIIAARATYTDGIAYWIRKFNEQFEDSGPRGPGVDGDAGQIRFYQDGLKGLEHGVKLLAELSSYEWKINS